MNVLKNKITELEYQNKVLNENYKSSSQGDKQNFLERLSLSEVRASDAMKQLAVKDDEINSLQREINRLRGRVQELFEEKETPNALMVLKRSGFVNCIDTMTTAWMCD